MKMPTELSATCHSNIALIKYWGKRHLQLPHNVSLSFTLSHCYTNTKAIIQPKTSSTDDKVNLQFFFENERNEAFERKVYAYIERIRPYIPSVGLYDWTFYSTNSFPHSSGIASSASGMGALAMIYTSFFNLEEYNIPHSSAHYSSYLARIGSGSACRSTTAGWSVWGQSTHTPTSVDEYAIVYPYDIHPNMRDICDSILIVEQGNKAVSSSAGHALLDNHPMASIRYTEADKNFGRIIGALDTGDWDVWGEVVEAEAMMLHALMMTSTPYYILMKPNTLHIIQSLWQWRAETKLPAYFTLDAGANVHLLYPKSIEEAVHGFINEICLQWCEGDKVIHNHNNDSSKLTQTQSTPL